MAAENLSEGELVVSVLSLRLLVCVSALGVDRLLENFSFAHRFSEMPKTSRILLHPVALFGALAAQGERIFNRAGIVSRFWHGVLLCVGLVFLAFVAGFFTEKLLSGLGWAPRFLGGSFVCGLLIAHASLSWHVGCVESALREGNLAKARRWLSHLVGRETRALSKERVGRGALESLSENCSDGTVAPLFYYVVGGMGGLFSYKAINTLDSMFGYRGKRYGLFGRFAARLDDVANIVPSRLTAWFFCVAAFFLRDFSSRAALRVMRVDALSLRAWLQEGFVSSPNALHPEAAMAGALGVRLGGVREYRLHAEVWRAGKEIGDGRRSCQWRDLARARRLVGVAVWSFFFLAAVGVTGGELFFG